MPTWACMMDMKLAMYEVSRCCGRAGAGAEGHLWVIQQPCASESS